MNAGRKRRIAGAALVAAGVAVAVAVLVPYAAELVGTDYSEYVYDDVLDDGGFPAVDWDALLAANPDVVGWVRAEGTPIDYPVVQARSDDPQRYLNHALDGSWSGHGTPYVAAGCDGADAALVLTYGHNMIDGSMYSAFAGYTDQGFFDAHREVLFLTPGHNFRLDAVAALEVSAWDHHPRTAFADAGELAGYLAGEAAHAAATGHVPDAVEQVFEFVCCSYGASNGRTLVYAVEPDAGGTVYGKGYFDG